VFSTILLTTLSFLPAQVSEGSESEAILMDWLHANDFSMIGLRPKTYRYHVLAGYRRAFDYLQSRGVSRKYHSDGPFTLEKLASHRLLFINLASAEREPFLLTEIQSIRRYVEQGGSLWVVTDHSNCYFHAHRLKPLFTELGIQSFTVTACEKPPRSLGNEGGWISVTRFDEHPVTSNLSCIAMRTGGCVDPKYAVAWTSEASWGDEWATGIYGEENGPGFYGDFSQNPGEPSGPLGVLLAKQLGSGRIIITADQNMFSDDFLLYADNYRLWLNIMAWLLRDRELRDAEPFLEWASPRVALFEEVESALFGRDDDDGYYHVFALLNRYHRCFAHARPSDKEDLIVFPSNECRLEPPQAKLAARSLQNGGNVLLLGSQGKVLEAEEGVVRAILRALPGASPTLNVLPGRVQIELPTAGSILVLTPPRPFDNTQLPPPTQAPSAEQKQHEQTLLDAVRDALAQD
jgi:hypothetical protein